MVRILIAKFLRKRGKRHSCKTCQSHWSQIAHFFHLFWRSRRSPLCWRVGSWWLFLLKWSFLPFLTQQSSYSDQHGDFPATLTPAYVVLWSRILTCPLSLERKARSFEKSYLAPLLLYTARHFSSCHQTQNKTWFFGPFLVKTLKSGLMFNETLWRSQQSTSFEKKSHSKVDLWNMRIKTQLSFMQLPYEATVLNRF